MKRSEDYIIVGESPEGTLPSAAPPLDSKKAVVPAVIDLLSMTAMMTFEGVVLGRFSSAALGGGGMALYVLFFLFTIFLTFVLGAAMPISRHLGAGDSDTATQLFGNSMGAAFIVSIVFAGGSYLFRGFIFRTILGASGDIEKSAVQYFTMLAIFMPVIGLNFTGTGILRSIGDSMTSMKVNLTANLINAGAVVILVYGHEGLGIPAMGARGAGLALGGAQAIGLLILLRHIIGGRTQVGLRLKDMIHPKIVRIKRILKAGFPVTLEQLIWMGGQLIIIAFVARIGEAELAAHQIIMRLAQTLGVIYQGYAFGNMAIVGRKIGAGDERSAARLSRNMRYLSLMTAILIALGVVLLRFKIAMLFSYDPKVISLVVWLAPILAVLQIPKSQTMITASELRARGDLIFIVIVCAITVAIDIVGFSAISLFVFGWGLAGVWTAHAFDEVVRLVLHLKRLSHRIVKNV